MYISMMLVYHCQGFLLQFEFPVLLGQLARSTEASCAEISYSIAFDHVTVAYLASRDSLKSITTSSREVQPTPDQTIDIDTTTTLRWIRSCIHV